MKKNIGKISVLLLVLSFLLPMFTTKIHALNSDPTRDKLRKALLISNTTDEKIKALGEGIITSSTDSVKAEDLDTPDVVIANYEEIVNDEKIISYLRNSINEGDVVYLRIINKQVDLYGVEKIFGNSGECGEIVVPQECAQNKIVCGYIIYRDEYGDFQIVSSEIGVVPTVDCVGADETKVVKTLVADLDMLNNFLQLNIVDSNEDYNQDKTRSNGTSYVEPVNTVVWTATVKNSNGENVTVNVGQTTMTVYADRLDINEDTTTWGDTSIWLTQWAFRSKIYIQPIWYQSGGYRSLNKLLRVYYTTHPNNPNGGTYGMHLLSLNPDSSFSGQRSVEMRFGADASLSGSGVSGEFSVTTSYPDIMITVRDFSRDDNTHHARIDFDIGKPTSPKTVNVGAVGIDSGVVAANYRKISKAMQIGYSAWWFVTQGSGTSGKNVYFSDYIVWQPGASW